ncbi:adenylate cyclase [Reticulomyxa filosa]|uniref:Adenylate cyclase n=1 Tax=Reticulomyxa filosa TaxID=46433 RepID=X6LCD8_RETFI|nr:adenylate cyclase [Reticulomyxa filosa]|eukprot:ETN98791.1 adenylate cyclase [Reticulomyxa filosa]
MRINMLLILFIKTIYKKKEHFAVEKRIKPEQKRKKKENKDEDNLNVLVESQLPLQAAENAFWFYLFCSALRVVIVSLYMGHIFQLKQKNEHSVYLLDYTLLIHSLLFLSYLWYQFKYLKYRNVTIIITANILYFTKIAADKDDRVTWNDILYSCIVFNCGIVSMTNSFYFTTKQQLCTMIDDVSNRARLHVERKEHARIMNSLMPAPVTEQILLRGDVPIYTRDVTIGFVYFTFYDKVTMEKIKDNSSFVEVLHQLVINFDKEIEQWEFDVVKIEHVGNTYLVCGGIMSSDKSFNHAEASFELYFNYLIFFTLKKKNKFRRILNKVNAKSHVQSELTMGIHTGPVMGTIIGTTRKFFRIFGDTVNTASRVCTTGLEGCIQATKQTYNFGGVSESFDWLIRGDIPMKGKGNICTYIVRGLNEDNENTSSTSSWIKRHITHKTTNNANLLEMNFYQFLNSEDTHASAFTLRFPKQKCSYIDSTFCTMLVKLFVRVKPRSKLSILSNDVTAHRQFSNSQIKSLNLLFFFFLKKIQRIQAGGDISNEINKHAFAKLQSIANIAVDIQHVAVAECNNDKETHAT